MRRGQKRFVPLPRSLSFFALVLALATLVGCKSESVALLPRWTLTTPAVPGGVVIDLPAKVDPYIPGPTWRGAYSLATHVVLPEAYRHGPVTLAIPYLPALVSLEVNGESAPGLDSADPRYYYRVDDPQRFVIREGLTRGGDLELVLRARWLWHHAGWVQSVPRLSPTATGDAGVLRLRGWNRGIDQFALWSVLICSFTHAALYLWERRASHGWFALAALCGTAYPAFFIGLFQPVFHTYDVVVLEIMLTAAAYTSLRAAFSRFPVLGPLSKWFGISYFASWVFTIAVKFFAIWPLRYAPAIVTALLLGTTAVYLGRLLKHLGALSSSSPTLLTLLTWPLALVFGLADAALWVGHAGVFGCYRGLSFGIGMVTLIRTVSFSGEFYLVSRSAVALSEELAKRVALLEARSREVQGLNNELRHQVASNATELASLLAAATVDRDVPLIKVGDVVEARYAVLAFVGKGASGNVYRVQRLADGRVLAMKLLRSGADSVALARLAREAELAMRISHKNVVKVVDIGVSATGFIFLVMEFVNGLSLRESAARYGDVRWACAVLYQVADGLAAIHAAGIVHRDLKPGNILLASVGDGTDWRVTTPKIADFGIASFVGGGAAPHADTEPFEASRTLTRTGDVVGTPIYMSPEAYSGECALGAPSDVFSLGLIARELLMKRDQHHDVPVGLVLNAAPETRLPPIHEFCPELPRRAAELVDACILLSPSARPTARELEVAIREAHLALNVSGERRAPPDVGESKSGTETSG